MPSLRNILAWATPVKPDLFGAHLEAHINLIPAITTLRLCHRRGDGSSFSKIPVELLVSIEDFLTDMEREETRKAWQADYKCFQEECSPMDHYEKPRLNELRRMIRLDTPRSDVLNDDDVDERLNEFIEDHTSYMDVHMERRESWEDRTDLGLTPDRVKAQTVMVKHFGLDFWVSGTRIAGKSTYGYNEASLTYIKLPQYQQGIRVFHLSPEEHDNKEFYFSGSGAMEVVGDLTLPKDGRAKMARCLSILGLEPFEHGTEKPLALPARVVKENEHRDLSSTWPRLTVLSEITATTED